EIRKIVDMQKELFQKLGIKKREFVTPPVDEALYQEVKSKVGEQLHEAMDTSKYAKQESQRRIVEIRKALLAGYAEDEDAKRRLVAHYFGRVEERLFRDDVVEKRQRPD